jgi:hypothetical protein
MSEQSDVVKELVQTQGFPVNIDSEFCKGYRAAHLNCFGCESEQGCARMTHILLVFMKAMLHKPVSFADSLAQDKWVQDQMAKALDKNVTIEELKNILT